MMPLTHPTDIPCPICSSRLIQLTVPSNVYGCLECHVTWRLVNGEWIREKLPIDPKDDDDKLEE